MATTQDSQPGPRPVSPNPPAGRYQRLFTAPDWLALVAAVRAAPADDAPRQAAADWLGARGFDSLSRFVRADNPASCPWNPLWLPAPLRGRGIRLTGRAADGRVRAVATGGGVVVVVEFRRGFLDRIALPAADWLAHGPAVVRYPLACVVRVAVADRGPVAGGSGWVWSRGEGGDRSGLPEPLFDALPGGAAGVGPGGVPVRTYPTVDAALTAASEAAIQWAWSAGPGG